MIYVAQILENKFIKIGFTASDDSRKRLAELQTGNPFLINLVIEIEGTLIQEQEIHKAMVAALTRIRLPMPPNEWYPGNHPFIKDFLEELKNGVNFGLAFLDKYNRNVKQPGNKNDASEAIYRWPKMAVINSCKYIVQ